ncbi:MAG: hypothetical protein ACTSRB_17620 [Candidatus Helarchaeota archaeon]
MVLERLIRRLIKILKQKINPMLLRPKAMVRSLRPTQACPPIPFLPPP